MKRAIFLACLTVLWATCIALIGLAWLEYFGGYESIAKNEKADDGKLRLYETAYYGHPLERDPYEAFSVQHVHPFYLFSPPWTAEGIAKANNFNSVVSLNARGFRNSGHNSAAKRGVILGGSATFGVGASSDQTTLASASNELQTSYDFENYGVPSWNSHQEMVVFTKIPFDVDYVIAFSGSNDFEIAQRYCQLGYDFPAGSPESFEHLASNFDDIRGDRRQKGFLANVLPQTLKRIHAKKKRKSGCRPQILKAADAFIANQRVIAELASVREAGYLLVLQPNAEFLLESQTDEETKLRLMFYQHVMDSDLCLKFRCVDLSHAFEGKMPLMIEDSPDDPSRAIFADKVHLTDHGYASVAALIVPELEK